MAEKGSEMASMELESDIINFLGVPEGKVDVSGKDLLDNAPENDLQLGEGAAKSSSPNTPNTHANVKTAILDRNKNIDDSNENAQKIAAVKKAKRDSEAKELKGKNAMPAPPPRPLEAGASKGKHVRLGNLEFTTEQVNGNTIHAHLKLSGRNIHGKTLEVDETTTMNGALHLKSDGEKIVSQVTSKDLFPSVFVNKMDVKSSGIAVGNEGGFFDHNDGFITYEPISSANGLKVNSQLQATGKIQGNSGAEIGGPGATKKSAITGRTAQIVLHANQNDVDAGGVAVSNAGGFFDFKDGAITFEPLDRTSALNVNAPFKVVKASEFEGDVLIKGDLHIEGHVNFGVKESDIVKFDSKFADFHKKNTALESRVMELESTNAALLERLERMETMMQEMAR